MKKIIKSVNEDERNSTISSQDLELINQYTLRKMKPEELFKFSIVLCDNEIDRDFEIIPEDSLRKLAKLFTGKTIIFDHDATSANQNARIFKTEVKFLNEKTSYNEQKIVVQADAYTLNNKQNEIYITKIIAGILKEVSIGFSIEEKICSICGKVYEEISNKNNQIETRCKHVASKIYGNQMCCKKLINPTDAYECSFVAIPSQKNAGVVKHFNKLERRRENTNEAANLHKNNIKASVIKLAFLTNFMDEKKESFQNIIEKLNINELEAFESELKKHLNREALTKNLLETNPSENNPQNLESFKI